MKILVFDDKQEHRQAAIDQLGNDHEVTVVSTYDEAEKALGAIYTNFFQESIIPDFDVVLTDLLVPASDRTQGDPGSQYIGKEMPIGTIIAFLALQKGIKKVGILTDENHHHHPAAAALDVFNSTRPFEIGDVKIVIHSELMICVDNDRNLWVKDWKKILEYLF